MTGEDRRDLVETEGEHRCDGRQHRTAAAMVLPVVAEKPPSRAMIAGELCCMRVWMMSVSEREC